MMFAGRRSYRLELVVATSFVLLCAAPTPGDIGSCGQKAAELDPRQFFLTKDFIDCERCNECQIESHSCDNACRFANEHRQFPEQCVPIVHDGEVCLRALGDASCSEYGGFMNDREPKVPTECNFCPAR